MPSLIPCGTVAEREDAITILSSLDLESLPELNAHCRLIDMYPYGLPDTIHFIADPRKSLSWQIILLVLSFPTAKPVDELMDLRTANDLTARRKLFFKNNPPKASSSEAQHPKQHTQRIMLWGRPEEHFIPPSLLDETL